MTPRSILLGVIGVVRWIFDAVATLCALGFLVILAFEFFHAPRIESTPVMMQLHRLGGPAIRWVSHWFGWHWPTSERNYAPLILAVAVFIGKSVVDGVIARLDFFVRRTIKAPKRAGLSLPTEGATPAKLVAETERDREVLLKRFREIENTLKTAARKRCTFVSIDVVGSTKMKVGERASTIAATFQAYEELVRKHFESYGVWKQTWTPDGVMACFLDTDLAVGAAQSILTDLPKFNEDHKMVRDPFHVRAGLNVGEVSIFEDSALEKIADHAIDVAGHMQKYAGEDELWLAQDVLATLASREGFIATGKDVDGHAAFAWTPAAPNRA